MTLTLELWMQSRESLTVLSIIENKGKTQWVRWPVASPASTYLVTTSLTIGEIYIYCNSIHYNIQLKLVTVQDNT